MQTPTVRVTAGPQRVSAAFVQKLQGPVIDLIAPIERTLADTQIGVAYGITTLPHLKDLSIVGPRQGDGRVGHGRAGGRSSSAGRRHPAEEAPCARRSSGTWRTRRSAAPVSEHDLAGLMRFYADGRKERDFESGVTAALEAVLASPQFLFRVEPVPARREARRARTAITDLELASRLSYFLWDARAGRRRCCTRRAPARCTRRACSSGRCAACSPIGAARRSSTRFAARVAAAAGRRPDRARRAAVSVLRPRRSPTALKRETELFFDSIVREDRSVLDLLTADYSFVNERVAEALRDPERHRERVPPRDGARRRAGACSARAAFSC